MFILILKSFVSVFLGKPGQEVFVSVVCVSGFCLDFMLEESSVIG